MWTKFIDLYKYLIRETKGLFREQSFMVCFGKQSMIVKHEVMSCADISIEIRASHTASAEGTVTNQPPCAV